MSGAGIEKAGRGLRLQGLVVYPVKGCRGIPVERWPLDAGGRGLEGDRRWMVVDAEGQFVSQRTRPAMARIETRWDKGGDLVLARDGDGEVVLPGDPDAGAEVGVTIWGDRLEALAPSPAADAWLSRVLEAPVRLVYQPDQARRPADPAYAPGTQVSLADAFPFLVISEASLAELNRRLGQRPGPGLPPISMARFRPNLVVGGAGMPHATPHAAPHAEDRWRRLRIGDVEMLGVKRCARCSVTTVDPITGSRPRGEAGTEPLRTLATYRSEGGKVYFGQNLVLAPTAVKGSGARGELRVGDPVEILEEGPVGP